MNLRSLPPCVAAGSPCQAHTAFPSLFHRTCGVLADSSITSTTDLAMQILDVGARTGAAPNPLQESLVARLFVAVAPELLAFRVTARQLSAPDERGACDGIPAVKAVLNVLRWGR